MAGFFLHSIKGRLILGVLLIHALLMSLVVADMVGRQRDFMRGQLAGEGHSMAVALAVNAPSWVISNDLNALDELVDSLKAAPNVSLAAILDATGRVRAATDPALVNRMLDDAASTRLLAAVKEQAVHRPFQHWHDGMMDTLAPVVGGGERVGFVRVILDGAPMQAELDAAVRKGAVYVVLAILVGTAIAWLLVHGMVWRLVRLSKVADDIAAGNLDVRPGEAGEGRDEVARLARDLDQMAAALRADRQARAAAEAALFAEKERALVTLHSIGDGVITTDTGGIVDYLNPVAEAMTGWTNDEAKGRPLREIFNIENEITRQPVENPVERAIAGNCIVGLANHTVLLRRDGSEVNIEDSAAPIRDRTGGIIGAVLVFHDVSERHRLTVQLSWQASHDALTGLCNRIEFDRRLADLLVDGDPEQEHTLLYLDLDQFKVVNDTCGHAAGDDLLCKLAERLQGRIRGSDVLARLGGDEFGILLVNCPSDRAHRIAEGLLDDIRAFRFIWEGKVFAVGASIGMMAFRQDGRGAATLLAAADTACYMAKEQGRDCIRIYQSDDEELVRRHGEMHWVARINRALENDAFVLYHQDIVPIRLEGEDVSPPRCDGPQTNDGHCEILVRMIDESGELIPPGAFIPAAERFGLMNRLDRWVVKNTLDWMTKDADAPHVCAINLSGQSIGDESFMRQLIEDVAASGVEPRRLCFEITETAAVAHFGRTSEFIQRVRALGCSFALDDFGTGMSSFSYLKNLPVDYLKIDGCFIRDMTADPVDAATVRAIGDVGHAMGLSVIAEFVENKRTCEHLSGIGIDFAQGYFHGKPVPVGE